jgi:hypothetical protein
VEVGGTFTLTWTSSDPNATCTASSTDPSSTWTGAEPTSGSANVTAPATQGNYVYTLKCTQTGFSPGVGTTSLSVGPVPPATVSMYFVQPTIQPGQAATLVWSTTNASSCTASGGDGSDGWSGTEATSGNFSVVTTATTSTGTYNYVLNCTGPGGPGAATAQLTVSNTPTPTVSLEPTAAQVAVGASDGLIWSTTNVSTCDASSTNPNGSAGTQFTGQVATSNPPPSFAIGPFSTAGVYDYTLRCGGSNGVATASTSVVVGTPPAPTVTLTVNGGSSATIRPGEAATLSWTSTNTTSCTAAGSWSGNEPLSGNVSTGILSTAGVYSYALTCSGPGGSDAATVSVTVAGASVTDSCGIGVPSTALLATNYVGTPVSVGICLLCSVTQPQNVVTPSAGTGATLLTQKPYSVLNAPVGVIGSQALNVGPSTTNASPTPFAAGTVAGMVVVAPGEVLDVTLLQSISLETTDQSGAVVEGPVTTTGLLSLDLLTLPIGNLSGGYVSFTTTKPYYGVLVDYGGVASVVGQLDVYEACITQ